MPVTEEGRHRLHQSLDRTIGPEEATTLMEHLPPVGWSDVATTQDLAHLEERLGARLAAERAHIDHRFDTEHASVEHRFDTEHASVEHRFDVERIHVDGRFDLVDERFATMDERFAKVDLHFDEITKRLDLIVLWMTSMERRFTHQFWQFLSLVLAVGAILIGILRFT